MVDVIRLSDPVSQTVEIVDGGKDIVGDDVLRNKLFDVFADGIFQCLTLELRSQFLQQDSADPLLHAELGGIEINKVCHIHHAVGENADLLPVNSEIQHDNTGLIDLTSLFSVEDLALFGDDFSCGRV